MAKMYYDKDANLDLVKGKKIGIIGYGSQGHAHAQNLRDSGCDVIVAEVEGSEGYKLAKDAGFEVLGAAEVAKAADITKVKAEVAVEAVLEAMKESMRRGQRIELRGFGVFQVKPRKRGIGRNPRTGKEVKIPPGRTIRFKPGKDLQNLPMQ